MELYRGWRGGQSETLVSEGQRSLPVLMAKQRQVAAPVVQGATLQRAHFHSSLFAATSEINPKAPLRAHTMLMGSQGVY